MEDDRQDRAAGDARHFHHGRPTAHARAARGRADDGRPRSGPGGNPVRNRISPARRNRPVPALLGPHGIFPTRRSSPYIRGTGGIGRSHRFTPTHAGNTLSGSHCATSSQAGHRFLTASGAAFVTLAGGTKPASVRRNRPASGGCGRQSGSRSPDRSEPSRSSPRRRLRYGPRPAPRSGCACGPRSRGGALSTTITISPGRQFRQPPSAPRAGYRCRAPKAAREGHPTPHRPAWPGRRARACAWH